MKKVFNTHGGDTSWNDRSGQVVEVLRPLTEDEADLFDVGPMFRIRFQDGTETDAFADELMDLPEEGGLVEGFDFEGIFSGCRGIACPCLVKVRGAEQFRVLKRHSAAKRKQIGIRASSLICTL